MKAAARTEIGHRCDDHHWDVLALDIEEQAKARRGLASEACSSMSHYTAFDLWQLCQKRKNPHRQRKQWDGDLMSWGRGLSAMWMVAFVPEQWHGAGGALSYAITIVGRLVASWQHGTPYATCMDHGCTAH